MGFRLLSRTDRQLEFDTGALRPIGDQMDASWQWLGNAAGTEGVGVNRVRVEPGKLPTPPHSHGASEELYFVLAGLGLAWQDGAVHEVRPLDRHFTEAAHDQQE